MDNGLFGKVFVAMFASVFLFFGVAQAGGYFVDHVIFPSRGFGQQTYIGAYDVSNLPESEAAVTVQSGVKGWYGQAQIQIKLQDAVVPFPLEVVEFNTDRTLGTAKDGEKNNLEFDVSKKAVETFLNQQFAPLVFTEEDISSVVEAIQVQLSTGRMDQVIDISNALNLTGLETEITSVTFEELDVTAGVQNLMAALNGYVINPQSTFSLLDFVASTEVGIVTDQDLTSVASLLYSAVLHTNFGIDERSIGPVVPSFVPIGYEASINQKLAVDFVFTNPNSTSFTFHMDGVGDGVNASLTGLPFIYSYQTVIGNKEEFPPKTIKQYSAFVEPNTVQTKTSGQNGVQVIVTKTILSGNDILETKEVSKDFYPPVHKVEVYPLTSTDTVVEPGQGNGSVPTDGTTLPPGETTDPSGNGVEPDPGNTSGGSTSGTGSGDEGNTNNGSGEGTTSGESSGDSTNDEPQYDKGGNLIPSNGK